MRMDKLTLKAQDAFSTAQNIATDMNHYEIQPEHLLKALIDQEGGIFESIAQLQHSDCRMKLTRHFQACPGRSGPALEAASCLPR